MLPMPVSFIGMILELIGNSLPFDVERADAAVTKSSESLSMEVASKSRKIPSCYM